jgi:hypothetical protein
MFFGEEKMRTREDKRIVKLDFLSKILFLAYISLFDAWSFLLVHIRFTPSEGPKGLVNRVLRNHAMEVGPSSWTMEKCYLPWCKPTLS